MRLYGALKKEALFGLFGKIAAFRSFSYIRCSSLNALSFTKSLHRSLKYLRFPWHVSPHVSPSLFFYSAQLRARKLGSNGLVQITGTH